MLKDKHILVVEDEWLLCELIAEMLVTIGCIPVGPACDVTAALHLADRFELDAALLDVKLRDKFTTEVADLLLTRGVPFAFVSGYSRSEVPRHQDAPVLEKPFTIDQLRKCLEGLFARDPTGPKRTPQSC
jgi:CheY-like chemotaxis protein